MSVANPAAAEIIEASAPAYAMAAASKLIGNDATIRERYGQGAARTWQAHLLQRVLELAAAIRMGEPSLFANRLIWQQRAFGLRELGSDDLRSSLIALGSTLADELPESLRDCAEPFLQAGFAVMEEPHEPIESALDPTKATGALALNYLLACLEGDAPHAIQLLITANEEGMTIETIYLEVLFAVQQEVGRMWHAGEASIGEERVVSETTRRAMTLLTQNQPQAEKNGKTVLAAAVALDTHEIGIRAVADFFQLAGWRALSLGSDMPPSEIAKAAQIFEVDLVVLGATLSTQLKQLQITIEHVRAACGNNVKILVGGHVFFDVPELWKTIGADALASNASDAVKQGAALVGLRN